MSDSEEDILIIDDDIESSNDEASALEKQYHKYKSSKEESGDKDVKNYAIESKKNSAKELVTRTQTLKRRNISQEYPFSKQQKLLQQSSISGCSLSDTEKLYQQMTSTTETFNYIPELRAVPEVCGEAKNATSPIHYWSLLITDAIIDQIVNHTNTEIRSRMSITYSYETTQLEIKAIIAVYYMRGLLKMNFEELHQSRKFFSILPMTLHRLPFLTSCLRFDDSGIGKETNKYDDLSDIREIWQTFIDNCEEYYSPSQNCTIGDQHLRYILSYSLAVPTCYTFKSGLKFIMINDAKTGYMIKAMLHTDEDFANKYENNLDNYVRELSERIHNSERNITTDHWFTSVPIVNEMFTKYSLTIISAIKEEKAIIPESFKRTLPSDNEVFPVDRHVMLVKYADTKNNIIVILSSNQYCNKDIKTAKSHIITTYNETKGGTKLFNNLCLQYTVARKALHTSLRVFYAMLDQAGVNSFILHNLNNSNEPLSREEFLHTLSAALLQPFLEEKYLEAVLKNPVVVDGT